MTTVPYRIRRSQRARVARILIDGDAVEVVVPSRFPLREVEPFVREKSAWIERTLRRQREAHAEFPPARVEPGGFVPYLGERLGLHVDLEPGRVRAHVRRTAGELRVTLGDPADLSSAVEAWYRRRARAEIEPRLDAAVERDGASYERLQIRAQRTRWASCSSNGTMSFNQRLLLAPPEILEYVIDHEVAHLEVLDHSRRFWALLGSRCPDWRRHEEWLRRHGHSLRL
ncbi:MAG TPA: SprT family zinc-dependent metalloprotease [Thermoleophilaceae bacterium]|nr:SprT family zinc-dependent metalloprotease [Thermoleophilaceae bacterium]